MGQVLFVPSGSAVSWHTVGPDGIALTDDSATVDPEHVPIVVEHCFVDASNLNRVKAELKVSSLKASKLASLLSMLQSPLLDTTLARRADVGPPFYFVIYFARSSGMTLCFSISRSGIANPSLIAAVLCGAGHGFPRLLRLAEAHS